jgi:outer membrane lipopolysaccharide assembly protein LptE/RlpB
VRRRALPIAAATAVFVLAGCEFEVETGEDAEETMEEHLDDDG